MVLPPLRREGRHGVSPPKEVAMTTTQRAPNVGDLLELRAPVHVTLTTLMPPGV